MYNPKAKQVLPMNQVAGGNKRVERRLAAGKDRPRRFPRKKRKNEKMRKVEEEEKMRV